MAIQPRGGLGSWCPDCGHVFVVGEMACPQCGLDPRSSSARDAEHANAQLHQIARQRRRNRSHQATVDALSQRGLGTRAAHAGASGPAAPVACAVAAPSAAAISANAATTAPAPGPAAPVADASAQPVAAPIAEPFAFPSVETVAAPAPPPRQRRRRPHLPLRARPQAVSGHPARRRRRRPGDPGGHHLCRRVVDRLRPRIAHGRTDRLRRRVCVARLAIPPQPLSDDRWRAGHRLGHLRRRRCVCGPDRARGCRALHVSHRGSRGRSGRDRARADRPARGRPRLRGGPCRRRRIGCAGRQLSGPKVW